jgi:cytochrome c oxidase cbb3-type subunit 2
MKNLNTLLAGVFFAVALPFGALILSGQSQLGGLGRAAGEEGGALFPSREPGLAIQGRAVYVSLGCVSCHTQQVRPAGQGSDIARGLGARPSVARDYALQSQVLLGERRLGPDLANYGARTSQINVETIPLPAARSGIRPTASWTPRSARPSSLTLNLSARITPRRKPN